MSMTISEATAVTDLVGFLDGTFTDEASRARACTAAQFLAGRASKPLQLAVDVDAAELDACLTVVYAFREAREVAWGDPADLADLPCPVCGERGCEKPTQLVAGRFRHVEDVPVAGGRL